MPGLIGFFKKDGLQNIPETVSKAYNLDISPTELVRSNNYCIEGIERPDAPVTISFQNTADQFIALFGHCFDRNSFAELKASQLAVLIRQKGLRSILDRLEGAFHVAWLDKRKNEFTLFNDRLGILPLYWTSSPDRFSFGPKIENIGRFGINDLNTDAFISFLMTGYCMGSTTLFKQVSYLCPGTVLKVDLDNYKISPETYWRLNYQADGKDSNRSLARDLHEAIISSIRLLCPPETRSRSAIFLSGGWDSKGLLGAMMATGSKPGRVITNGEADRLSFSDTNLAKKIASAYSIPCTLNLKDIALCNTNCLQGLKQSEIITDSNPEVFGQHNPPREIFGDIDYILKGDEVWGWQDMAYNRNQAIGHVMPNTVPEKLSNLINGSSVQDLWKIYDSQISQVLPDQKASNWNDFKDLLYLYGRVNRYIFGLGRSDEEHIQVRRPFLTSMVLDVISRIPGKLRVQKNLYKETMVRYQPELVAFGTSYTSSIPDYYVHMRPFIQQRMDDYFNENADFNGLLNLDACRSLIAEFIPSTSPKNYPSTKLKLRKTIENRTIHLVHRTGIYQRKAAYSWERKFPTDERMAFRLWLLTEFFYNNLN